MFGISDEAILQKALALARHRNAEVSFQKIALEQARGLIICGVLDNGDVFTHILVDKHQTTYGKAFIICHELGHLAKHTKYGNVLELDLPLRQKLEREADRFAIKLMHQIKRELLLQRVRSTIFPNHR